MLFETRKPINIQRVKFGILINTGTKEFVSSGEHAILYEYIPSAKFREKLFGVSKLLHARADMRRHRHG
jgi:hypothetical protein